MPTTRTEHDADATLIERTRQGDRAAFAQLWQRHAASGRTVARSYSSLDPDDLVSESFTRIYDAILAGKGPTAAFRPYLFTTIRNTAASWGRARHETNLETLESFEDPDTSESASLDALDRSTTAQAFRSLPTPLAGGALVQRGRGHVAAAGRAARGHERQQYRRARIPCTRGASPGVDPRAPEACRRTRLPLDHRPARHLYARQAACARHREARGAPRRVRPVHDRGGRGTRGRLPTRPRAAAAGRGHRRGDHVFRMALAGRSRRRLRDGRGRDRCSSRRSPQAPQPARPRRPGSPARARHRRARPVRAPAPVRLAAAPRAWASRSAQEPRPPRRSSWRRSSCPA